MNAVASNVPTAPAAPAQTTYYKGNTKWQGFAEPYGMNIATDDRATLYGSIEPLSMAGL